MIWKRGSDGTGTLMNGECSDATESLDRSLRTGSYMERVVKMFTFYKENGRIWTWKLREYDKLIVIMMRFWLNGP